MGEAERTADLIWRSGECRHEEERALRGRWMGGWSTATWMVLKVFRPLRPLLSAVLIRFVCAQPLHLYLWKIVSGEMDEGRDVMGRACNFQVFRRRKKKKVFKLVWVTLKMQYVPWVLKTELSHKRERITFGKNKRRHFSPPSFCPGFTNTSHVNEAGSISVVPGAWIVFAKKRERQRDNVFAG